MKNKRVIFSWFQLAATIQRKVFSMEKVYHDFCEQFTVVWQKHYVKMYFQKEQHIRSKSQVFKKLLKIVANKTVLMILFLSWHQPKFGVEDDLRCNFRFNGPASTQTKFQVISQFKTYLASLYTAFICKIFLWFSNLFPSC